MFEYQNLEQTIGLKVSNDQLIDVMIFGQTLKLTIKEATQLKSALAVGIDVATNN